MVTLNYLAEEFLVRGEGAGQGNKNTKSDLDEARVEGPHSEVVRLHDDWLVRSVDHLQTEVQQGRKSVKQDFMCTLHLIGG